MKRKKENTTKGSAIAKDMRKLRDLIDLKKAHKTILKEEVRCVISGWFPYDGFHTLNSIKEDYNNTTHRRKVVIDLRIFRFAVALTAAHGGREGKGTGISMKQEK